jgi:DNA-binding beta-propeller fold protein YncE
MASPKCFISYSWDSDDHNHKNWVRQLATELQRKGVLTHLDQWDVHPGTDLTKYMETCIRESDFVLLICTPIFAQKANAGIGGVGYEKSIVTGEIFQEAASPKKFVPILRKGDKAESLPSYLKPMAYIDFRNDDKFDLNLDELLRHLHQSPKYKPPSLGQKPNFSEKSQYERPIYFDLIKMIKKKKFELSEINELRGIAIGKEGNIYISDIGNNRIHIFSSKFNYEKSFGKTGSESGNLNGPRGIAIDNDNKIYVVDRDNSRINKFDCIGNFIDQFGSEDEKSLLVIPWGICIDKFDNIYVSSAGSHQIKKFDKKGRLIKYWGELGKGEGQFKNPLGIAIDKFQNVYIADNLNNRIQKFDQEGNFILKWGTYGDEPGQINNPYAITIYGKIVYVVESINFRIQLFDLDGNYIGKLQTKPENMFFSCKGIAIDNNGDLYLSNTEMHHIVQLTCEKWKE